MDHGWRQQLIAMHFGDELEINDAGYLSRNNTNYLHWQLNRRFTEPAGRVPLLLQGLALAPQQ